MEDLCKRIPLVAGMILKNLDNQSLMICKESSRAMFQYLNEEKLVSVRIIKEYKKFFVQFQNVWEKVVKKASVEIVQEFVTLFREFFNPRFPTDNIYDGRHKRREKQWHPLWMATLCGHLELCKFIIEKTGYTSPLREDGLTPLHFAVQSGDLNVCKVIIKEVADKNPKCIDGITPLHMAADFGHLEVCKLLIKEVADKNPGTNARTTPLHMAAGKGNLDICKLICHEIDNKNPENGINRTPLQIAASRNHWKVVYFLISVNNLHVD
jgi:hypothetical protein